MRTALRLMFIVFYVASSYAITQERTEIISEHVLRVSTRLEQPRFEETCRSLFTGYPDYRQAKPKPGAAVYFSFSETVHLLPPQVSYRSFTPTSVSFKSVSSPSSVLSRAPPLPL